MSWCRHKTPRDHQDAVCDDGKQVWVCTQCDTRDVWGPEWSYWGSLECKHCGWSAIDWVACSNACSAALERK